MIYPPAPVSGRRDFVAIAVAEFDDPAFGPLAGVKDEVKTLRDWLCDTKLEERAFADPQPHLADNPLIAQVRDDLGKPDGTEWSHMDTAVVFVTTHGWVVQHSHRADQHWLAFGGTDKTRPTRTALSSSELVGILQEIPVQHLMLILDTCHAGQIAAEIKPPDDRSWIILPSATATEEAGVGELSRAITSFLNQLSSPAGAAYGLDEYLAVSDFMTGIEQYLGDKQFAGVLYPARLSGPHPCLPNPHYRPPTAVTTDPARRDLALLKPDLATHWEPRARGVTTADEPGWLFSGRRELMRRLIAFTRDEPGVLLVTGGAGSGKSAVLARLVTLSDADFRAAYTAQVDQIVPELLPTEGAVDVAVLATGKNALEILTQICGAVGAIDASSPPPTIAETRAAWDKWISTRTTTLTIVVDALDEASNPTEVVTNALQPLVGGRQRNPVRLLVGVRCTGGATLADTPRDGLNRQLVAQLQISLDADPTDDRLQVDQAPWWQVGDVEDYVASILLGAEGSPYQAQPEAVSAIARLVAGGSKESFLVAKLAAEQLAARADVVDPTDGSWQEAIHQGVLGVFRADLHQTLPERHDRERAVHLLRAVAFSYGRGLPWGQIWPVVANAVADDDDIHYGNGDIAWLLSTRLGGYLVTDREDGVTVYRLFHDDLRTNLREHWRELLDGDQP